MLQTMKNKKILLSVFIILIIISALVLKYNFESKEKPSLDRIPSALPIPDKKPNVPINSDTPALRPVKIETPGGAVLMSDPREIEETSAMGSGIFSLTTLENINPYSFGVIFNETNGSFAIGLEKEPIAQARRDAEAYMKRTLGVSEEDMCLLNIFVGVPFRVNEFYSGKNLGLSFCPGSVSL